VTGNDGRVKVGDGVRNLYEVRRREIRDDKETGRGGPQKDLSSS